MTNCDCTFSYWSVIPPTHCPKCGRCLGCGQHAAPYQQPYPVYPQWQWPYPYTQPVTWPWNTTTITYTTASAVPHS